MRTCQYAAENLGTSTACGGKMSGVSHLYYVPRNKVASINWALPASATSLEDIVTLAKTTGGTAVNAIDLASSTKWSKLEFRQGHAELTYTVQGEKGGHSVMAKLSIERNGFTKKPLGFYTAALNEEYVMIAALNNGEYHLLGDMQHGMEMADDGSATSGKATTDANLINFNFEWQTNFPMVFGDSFDPEAGTGLDTIDLVK